LGTKVKAVIYFQIYDLLYQFFAGNLLAWGARYSLQQQKFRQCTHSIVVEQLRMFISLFRTVVPVL
jgi:hypothetical protein